ncbi:hypothetical protein QWY86_11960 [Pedobacter aquatilis]|uniref:hypothetical protein n=1 Tax=Pedobacter aquatilis TaxID=351343 RepID=UPI0025B38AEC|nr:hypothetical protein [Pedobacter aquatilis]MDN3587389.1 hypothetical protein [Pedobacter aquatilis]
MLLKIEFKKIRDFGQIINDTFTFVRQNFKPLVKTYFIFSGLFMIAGMLAMLLQQYKMVNIVNNLDGFRNRGFGAGLYGLEYFLAILFSLAGYASTTVATLSYIAIYVQKGNLTPTTDEVWGYFKYYFFRIFGSSLLLGLLLAVGFLFCLLPGFWLMPIISLVFPIIVIENGTIGYAFNRSFKLIKDNFWITFGTLFIIWIIVYACMSFVVLPTTLFSMLGLFSGSKPQMSLTFTMLGTVIQYLCQVCTVIPIITIALSYFSLVEQKESAGLMQRISTFGNEEKPVDNRPEEY